MQKQTHSLATATSSQWVYTMDVGRFQEWMSEISKILDPINEEMMRAGNISRSILRNDERGTERQWRTLQALYNRLVPIR